MSSKLLITSVEGLQREIVKSVKTLRDLMGIYVSLNRPQRSVEPLLDQAGIDTKKIFFIDCVDQEKQRDDVLHVRPDQIETLKDAINDFVKEIHGEKFLLIDALSTLLIYNPEEKVSAFVQWLSQISARREIILLAFSPHTKGEELLGKIFNFFDEVEKPQNQKMERKNEAGEDFVY